MDFAELDVLQEQSNFLIPFIDSVHDNEREFKTVMVTAGCDAQEAYPDSFFTNNSDQRRNRFDEIIRNGFDRFMKKTHRTIGTLVEAFQLKVDTLTMAVKDRDIEINNLTIELEQLKEAIAQDNQKVQEALNNSPPLKEVYLKYQANPRATLSTDQQTILRLSLEIKKLNGELRLAISNNMSLKNKNNLLKKQYSDKNIVENEVNQIRMNNVALRQEKEELLEELERVKIELVEAKKLIPKKNFFHYLKPSYWLNKIENILYQCLILGFLTISSLLSLRISVKLFLGSTTLTVIAFSLKYLGYF